MNKLLEKVNKLGPFGCINIEIEKGSTEFEELSEVISLEEIPIGSIDEYEVEDAKIKVHRWSYTYYQVDVVKRCTGVLGKF